MANRECCSKKAILLSAIASSELMTKALLKIAVAVGTT
jgi:hypothetical protein